MEKDVGTIPKTYYEKTVVLSRKRWNFDLPWYYMYIKIYETTIYFRKYYGTIPYNRSF